MADLPISALSLEHVRVPITATLNGSRYNPTADTVQLAFMAIGTRPSSGDWIAGSWETAGSGATVQYYALALVGPGGAKTLTPGRYVIWIKITDNPEIPVLTSPGALVVV